MNVSETSLTLAAADFRMQTLSSLTSSDSDATSLFMAAITGKLDVAGNNANNSWSWLASSSDANELAASGRAMALADPESAYSMMTVVNNKNVLYKAQFSELSRMETAIAGMQQAAQTLNISVSTDNGSIKSQLQGFVDQYNTWIRQFGDDMKQGGLLADTQAAQVARRELDQSIKNIFNGVKDGVHGLSDIGITIDDTTGLATLDTTKLNAMVSANKQGVADAMTQFSANFAEAARLLNSDGNFMPSQLDNLDRAIHYIDDNSASLQAEFGVGDITKPTGAIAQALAAYNRIYGS